MLKNTVIALVAAVSVAGVAAPAFADYDLSDDFQESYVLNSLASQGVNASAVENWGDAIRAYVTLEDGTTVMRFFDADTLQAR